LTIMTASTAGRWRYQFDDYWWWMRWWCANTSYQRCRRHELVVRGSTTVRATNDRIRIQNVLDEVN
jgi:hypothetical protein